MKVTKIQITKNWGVRPTNENIIIAGSVWCVEKGEQYDLVQFGVDEISGYMWRESLCVPCGTSEEEAMRLSQQYADTITDDDVKGYKEFIEFCEKYGWD